MLAGLWLHIVIQGASGASNVPPFVLPGLMVLGAGVHKLVRSRGYRARSAAEVLSSSDRPPVLYLRSFADDSLTAQRTTLGFRSEEQQMVNVLRRIGPVVALGAPAERVPALGAARDYVAREQWKEWVLDKLAIAALTVIRVSDTDSFCWEVRMAAEHVPLQRIAFLLPLDASQYAAFRARICEHFPAAQTLPDVLPRLNPMQLPGAQSDEIRVDRWGLLYFDEQGHAQLRSMVVHAATVWEAFTLTLSLSKTQPFRASFESLFTPLLRRTGARVSPIPQPFGMLIMLGGFYMVPLFWLWARRKGRPPMGPDGLDDDYDPYPPEVAAPWTHIFTRAVAPILALAPVCIVVIALLATSAWEAIAFVFATLIDWLPFAVVFVLVVDARLRRREALRLPRGARDPLVGFIAGLALVFGLIAIVRPMRLEILAAFAVIAVSVIGIGAAVGVYVQIANTIDARWRGRRDRIRT
ncbi:MAG: hypothetical protein JO286_13610 [Solirubrobacterales bacterium]|nr:hypothetical protein [Solirubrobacterales bacterium]